MKLITFKCLGIATTYLFFTRFPQRAEARRFEPVDDRFSVADDGLTLIREDTGCPS
jgi:hypothetical protein